MKFTEWLKQARARVLSQPAEDLCLQCGFPPKRQLRIVSDDPFLHPHECSWCHSVLLVPGLMMDCRFCSKEEVERKIA